jgi:GAF domain-containing protein
LLTVTQSEEVHGTHQRLAEIVRELHARPETDADTVIAELAEHAAAEVPGASYAGITVTRDHNIIDTPAATHPYPIILDKIQQRHRQGPCLEAAWEEKTIHVPDLEHDDRWPLYRRDALAQTPVRSIMAFELFIADHTMGALNVYADQPHAFDDESKTIGLIFAAHTSVTWNVARRDEQFRRALASRDVIGQAKGMIMERYGVNAVQAFDMLRKLSQDSNTPVAEVAADVVKQADPSPS